MSDAPGSGRHGQIGRNAEQSVVGRYAMGPEIAAGGMATVHLGKLLGPVGFSRIVAIKALHPQFARDPDFLSMFLDEARLAGRVRHPNVVSVFDVVVRDSELFLVMDYVPGETLSRLQRTAQERDDRMPLPIALSIVAGALDGLHAAHEAADEYGNPLDIVHRDISPQNVLVGIDGSARILDFGIAKAVGRMQSTRNDQLKGKLAYMAPEQLWRRPIDRRADVYAASIVLWELLTHQRLFQGDGDLDTYQRALEAVVAAPSQLVPDIPKPLDAIVLKGLSRAQGDRFATARDMARAIEETGLLASARDVGAWVERIAREPLAARARALSGVEQGLAPADAWRELDPAQARDDASLLRKLDRRAEAEQITDVRQLGEAAEDLPGPPSSVDSVVTAIAARSATNAAHERPRNRWPIWLSSSLAALLFLGLLWSLKRPQGTLPAVVATPKLGPASPATPTLVAAPPEPAPAASVAPTLHAPQRRHPANHAGSAEPATVPAADKPKPAERPKPDCSVPFTVDEHGFRIPKRECL